MHFKAKLLATVCAAVVLGAAGVAKAEDKTPTNVPGSQGLNSVDKNLKRDPDNRGLENAQQRIEDNIQDRRDRKAVKADRDDKKPHAKDKGKARRDRDDKGAGRPERPERAGHS